MVVLGGTPLGIRAGRPAAAFGIRPSAVLLVLLTVPLLLGSVWLGRRTKADRRWLWAVLPLNVFAMVVGLIVLDMVPVERVTYVDFGDRGPAAVTVPVPAFGNVYPFDANGRPLSGVYLYDENGQPIISHYPVSECMPTGRVPVPANQFPQPVYEYDRSGECVPRSGVPTPSQLPTPTPTPAPTG